MQTCLNSTTSTTTVNFLKVSKFKNYEFSDTDDDIFCALANLHLGKPNRSQLKKIIPEITKGYYYKQLKSKYFTLMNDKL